MKKTIIFIDGANIFYTQKKIKFTINWFKVKKLLSKEYKIRGIYYYTGIKEGDLKMKKYLNYLNKLDIQTITKPLKLIKDEKGKIIFKSNCDVEICVDILTKINEFDNLILFSGDSDFVYLLRILKEKYNKKIIIYSSRRTISWEIKLIVDKYIFLEDIKDLIKR